MAILVECVNTSTSIGKAIFKDCYCEANYVAHELAKFSCCNKGNNSWVDESLGFDGCQCRPSVLQWMSQI